MKHKVAKTFALKHQCTCVCFNLLIVIDKYILFNSLRSHFVTSGETKILLCTPLKDIYKLHLFHKLNSLISHILPHEFG